jgi:hypothetical protein
VARFSSTRTTQQEVNGLGSRWAPNNLAWGLAELGALSWSLTRIAKALASGATVTDIAEAEGIGRTLASREANNRQVRLALKSVHNRSVVYTVTVVYTAMVDSLSPHPDC